MIETAEQMRKLVAEEIDRFRTVEKEFLLPYLARLKPQTDKLYA